MKATRKQIAHALRGQTRSISKGRSHNSAAFHTQTPIETVPGTQAPELLGHPYLKTQFTNGNFSKTLYTYSTLHVVVGEDWQPQQLKD
jgi:hypothetical protein